MCVCEGGVGWGEEKGVLAHILLTNIHFSQPTYGYELCIELL